ncbi:signal recognition particle-docking protein FtsY [Candidatus Pacearchaeota archaeon CG06_land_8_20_14_3_00_35_12]|nr:MAG: signal recognition particle-docking protein FtsY [Candidatus Pacearchaeota archaeon CG06_land_8_20_14_3_00_35_12]
MFKFLKEKIKSWFSKSSEKIEEEEKKEEVEGKKEIEKEMKKELVKEKKEIKEEVKEKEISKEEGKKEEKKVEEEVEEKKESIFDKLKKTFTSVKLNEEHFEKIFEELEIVLIENSVAMEVIEDIKKEMKKELLDHPVERKKIEDEIKEALKRSIDGILVESYDLIEKIKEEVKKEKPYKVVFFGINGSGKTTSIAKIGWLLKKNNISCVLAAADTFRAASMEQLSIHASNLGIEMIKHAYGADPAAVAYDAIKHAKAENIDVVLIDTAGRMHSNVNLMTEMEKICRIAKPNLKIFVGEAITGNDATEQAKIFNGKIGIDGIILTKSDVDEQGGAIISVSHVTKKPIFYLGMGQEYKDFERFDKDKIIKLLGF